MAKFREQVVEPFTGLGRDDLVVEVEETKVRLLVGREDALLARGFETPLADLQPCLQGESVSLDRAIARAAEILSQAGWTLIAGLATDMAGMRAALELADQIGAVVDPAAGEALLRNVLVLQDRGWMTTTLAEVKNRADVLLAVGVDLDRDYPSFLERCFTGDGMFVEAKERKLFWLGPRATNTREGAGLSCPLPALFQEVARLKAIVEGHPVTAEAVLFEIAEALKNARYPVVVWSAAALNFPHAELLIEMLTEMVKHLNQKGRAAGLPLGGRNGSTTAQNVTSWQTGYPLRVSFARGFPEYDPLRFSAKRLLAEREVDALLWIEAYDPENLPPPGDLPKVVLGRSGMKFEKPPEVYIPIGTPGIDHAGHTFRMDGGIALRLRKLRESSLPSAAEVLQRLRQIL